MRHKLTDLAQHRPITILAAIICFISLYPAPSPLFHILFLPALLITEKHDRHAFLALAIVFVLVNLTIGAGTSHADLKTLLTETSGNVSLILTVIVSHRRCLTQVDSCRAWVRAWSFGILWAALWVAVVHMDPTASPNGFTPSAARHEFLRPLLRFAGEAGINILLGTSAYMVFLCIDFRFEQTTESEERWEWYSLLGLSRPVRYEVKQPLSVPSSPPDSTSGSKHTVQLSASDSRSPPSGQSESRSTPSEQDGLRSDRDVRPTYGTFSSLRVSTNLIDLESARSSRHSEPRSTDEPSCGPAVAMGSPSSDESNTGMSITSPQNSEDDTDELSRDQDDTDEVEIGVTAILVLVIWAILLCLPQPSGLSLSAPLPAQTPFSVACVLPPTPYTLDKLVYHSQTVSARSKLLVWPKGALRLADDQAKDVAVGWVHEMVTAQYGVWVVVSLEIGHGAAEEQMIVVGHEGVVGSPPGQRGEMRAGLGRNQQNQWTLQLPPPHGVTRFNWTQGFPHLRPVHVAAVDLAKAGRADAGLSDYLPSIIVVPSNSVPNVLDSDKARDLAVKHGAPIIVCASSDESSTSALIDSGGILLFRQQGGETWSANVALPYREGRTRSPTTYEVLGDAGPLIISALGFVILILVDCALSLFWARGEKATYYDGLSGWWTVDSERTDWSRSTNMPHESAAPRTSTE